MSSQAELEQRLSSLERDVALLKSEVGRSPESTKQKRNWLEGFIGLFKDYEDFEEMVKLGQEYRRSQRYETHG